MLHREVLDRQDLIYLDQHHLILKLASCLKSEVDGKVGQLFHHVPLKLASKALPHNRLQKTQLFLCSFCF